MSNSIIEKTEEFVREKLKDESSGHDWYHIYRVTKLAETIAEHEGADRFICVMAALLHDIADEKIAGTEEEGLKEVKLWLESIALESKYIDHIVSIISTMSFKGGNQSPMQTIEGKVVQDADRLDAIGAIGIGRTFAYSGAKGQLMYDPNIPVREKMTKDQYRNEKSTAVNHFYEKLLKLKDKMNTEIGKKMADERHAFLEKFLEQFFEEWEGKR
ncbi:HD domain-containing protein [Fictibacillus phosphorivorans]|uniref:HD domain-containing protein n=1 Tax=Fictibacillus phosphorivorans TaxID=1221500 RepID=UPI00203D5137|nr:HD domain-containing protein [Fictibacillus phosphorivorans]MCM3719629.1 HD domain-containing protein [Fictibacillus phosphorivorans]MCM3777297.1 HD domain-containing protein [Fictibacillus phosphorivorans]